MLLRRPQSCLNYGEVRFVRLFSAFSKSCRIFCSCLSRFRIFSNCWKSGQYYSTWSYILKIWLPNFISILINLNINFHNILLRINKQRLLEQLHSTIKISLILIDQSNIIQRECNCRIILIKEHSESLESLVVAFEGLLELFLFVTGVAEVQ